MSTPVIIAHAVPILRVFLQGRTASSMTSAASRAIPPATAARRPVTSAAPYLRTSRGAMITGMYQGRGTG